MNESKSTSSQTTTYGNASQSGSVTGGSSTSWTNTINGSATHGPATQPAPYHYPLSMNYSPSDSGAASEPSGGGGVPWLECLGLGANPAAAFAFGLLQGATNIANGVAQVVGGGDWSRGAFVYESDGAHSLSKNLGSQGASILLMGGLGQATILARLRVHYQPHVLQGRGVGMGVMGAGSELGQFAHAVSNGDGYSAVEHGGLALMNLLDVAAGFGQACFAAGMPIVTREGSKAIEEIRLGDYVLAAPEDDPDAAPSFRRVEAVFQTFAPLQRFSFELHTAKEKRGLAPGLVGPLSLNDRLNGRVPVPFFPCAGRTQIAVMELRVEGRTILTTAEHPFWVQGRGWIDAQVLKAGDLLWTDDGRWLAIAEAGRLRDPAPVYNMRVADYHTYFVGCDEWGFSVWAHNTECGEGTIRRAQHADMLEQQGIRSLTANLVGQGILPFRRPSIKATRHMT